jgi:hypothetical protein
MGFLDTLSGFVDNVSSGLDTVSGFAAQFQGLLGTSSGPTSSPLFFPTVPQSPAPIAIAPQQPIPAALQPMTDPGQQAILIIGLVSLVALISRE